MQSFKSRIDRTNFFDVPSYGKFIDIINKINDKPWIKPCLSICLACGARISEVLYLKRGDIKFIDYSGNEIPHDQLVTNSVAIIHFNLFTEKRRGNKYRIVPLIKNELFRPLVENIVEYCAAFKYDDTLLFPYTRGAAWYAIKRNCGRDMFPHFFRHTNATRDSMAGISTAILVNKMGWASPIMAGTYIHANVHDVVKAQQEAFGSASPGLQKINELAEESKAKIQNSLESAVVQRADYNTERNYTPEPIKEANAVFNEQAAHPESIEYEKTKNDVILEKIVKEMAKLPEFNDAEPREEPVMVDPVDPQFKYERPNPANVNFEAKGMPENTKPIPAPMNIPEEHASKFKTGMIVKDHLVVVTGDKRRVEKLKRVADPNRYIFAYNKTQAVKTREARGIIAIQQKKKAIADNEKKFLQVV